MGCTYYREWWQNPNESIKNAEKSKIVAFLFFNVKNIYYFCTRKTVDNIKLTQ